jgi:hypothetical protein
MDAMSKSNDNVLFSVSDTEAGWHTDGASKDRVYDVVSLLCISPASEGGKFRISNACESISILPPCHIVNIWGKLTKVFLSHFCSDCVNR